VVGIETKLREEMEVELAAKASETSHGTCKLDLLSVVVTHMPHTSFKHGHALTIYTRQLLLRLRQYTHVNCYCALRCTTELQQRLQVEMQQKLEAELRAAKNKLQADAESQIQVGTSRWAYW
jgi:hypothetical protein